MIIIVEGPDGAGKTTLVNELLKSHPGSTSKHFSNPKSKEEALNYWKVYAEAVEATDPTKVTIFDRCWYSDMVYGPLFRGELEMDARHARMLDALAQMHGGCFLIYCTAPINVLWARCVKRGEEFVLDKHKLAAVSSSYDDVLGAVCTLPVVRFDTK